MGRYLNFEGKIAAVTGGGGILCAGFAKELALNGIKVALLDIDLGSAQRVADEIETEGGTAIALHCDVLNKESVVKAAEEVKKEYGPVHILLNGAGGNNMRGNTSEYLTPELLEDPDLDPLNIFNLTTEGFQFVFNLNFMGTFIPSQAFLPHLVENREQSCIINIASMSSFRPMTQVPAYSAAKAAVANLTQFFAVHLAPVGVRANAIAPGYFMTKMNYALLMDKETGGYTPRAQRAIAHTPYNRFGVPEELLGSLLFLCDPAMSGFLTGVVLPVDGGFLAYSGV